MSTNSRSFTLNHKARVTFLSWIVLLSFIGLSKPVLFQEGSAVSKYIIKKQELSLIADQATENYMENMIFDDGDNSPTALVPETDQQSINDLTDKVKLIDKVLFILVGLIALYPLLPRLREKRRLSYLLLLPALWIFTQALATSLNGGKAFSEIATFAHATRWAAPLAFFLLIMNEEKQSQKLQNFVAFSCALTFFAHGWEALQLNPAFIDLIYQSSQNIGLTLSLKTIHILLYLIGTMDLLLALTLVFKKLPKLLLWMTFWGCITALSRPLAVGLEHGWQESLIRAANPGLPLFLYFLITSQRTESENEETKTLL